MALDSKKFKNSRIVFDTESLKVTRLELFKKYIGFGYNKLSPVESDDAGEYIWSLFQGTDGTDGVQGVKGDNGQTYYTWIKYADELPQSFSTPIYDEPNESTVYIGIAVNQLVKSESANYNDYVWSKFKGDDGIAGRDGKDGKDAVTYYTWIKYADDTKGTNMTNEPIVNGEPKLYIGFAYNKITPEESNVASDYKWSLIKGIDGPQGIAGAKGEDGKTYYTWIKYADTYPSDENPTIYDESKDTTEWIGLAVNKLTTAESTDYRDYSWSRFKGDRGVAGKDGITYFTWIMYADDRYGTNMSNTPIVNGEFKEYIGFAYNKTTPTESYVPTDYEWTLFKGANGKDGIDGVKGEDGVTTYTWIKYANKYPEANSDIYDEPTGLTEWIGIATNQLTITKSNKYTDYYWSKFKGDEGVAGAQGAQGAQGAVTYTWIRYADDANGSGLSNNPAGKEYIGFAYNKLTPVESDQAKDYVWTKIKGADGLEGAQGAIGAKGEDGKTYYTIIRYSDEYPTKNEDVYATPTDNTKYIGIITNYPNQSGPADYQMYSWSKYVGDDGVDGKNGITYYTWIMYADDRNGNGISNSPLKSDGTFKRYIGFAYGKTSPEESTNPADYMWSLFSGLDGKNGIDGQKGEDGTTYYTWIKYADEFPSTSAVAIYDEPTLSTEWIGIAVNKLTKSESDLFSDYTWSKFKGDDGAKGAQGAQGAQGDNGDDGEKGRGIVQQITLQTRSKENVMINSWHDADNKDGVEGSFNTMTYKPTEEWPLVWAITLTYYDDAPETAVESTPYVIAQYSKGERGAATVGRFWKVDSQHQTDYADFYYPEADAIQGKVGDTITINPSYVNDVKVDDILEIVINIEDGDLNPIANLVGTGTITVVNGDNITFKCNELAIHVVRQPLDFGKHKTTTGLNSDEVMETYGPGDDNSSKGWTANKSEVEIYGPYQNAIVGDFLDIEMTDSEDGKWVGKGRITNVGTTGYTFDIVSLNRATGSRGTRTVYYCGLTGYTPTQFENIYGVGKTGTFAVDDTYFGGPLTEEDGKTPYIKENDIVEVRLASSTDVGIVDNHASLKVTSSTYKNGALSFGFVSVGFSQDFPAERGYGFVGSVELSVTNSSGIDFDNQYIVGSEHEVIKSKVKITTENGYREGDYLDVKVACTGTIRKAVPSNRPGLRLAPQMVQINCGAILCNAIITEIEDNSISFKIISRSYITNGEEGQSTVLMGTAYGFASFGYPNPASEGTIVLIDSAGSSDNIDVYENGSWEGYGVEVGDMYLLSQDKHIYMYDGNSWIDKGKAGGDDGITHYTWIKYSDVEPTKNSDIYDTPKETTAWMGINEKGLVETPSNFYGDYKWSNYKGAKGAQGAQGAQGTSKVTYTWIRYADDVQGNGISDSPYTTVNLSKPIALNEFRERFIEADKILVADLV